MCSCGPFCTGKTPGSDPCAVIRDVRTGANYTLTPRPSVPTTDLMAEAQDVLARFQRELKKATGDGSVKRRSAGKPPWYEDDSHEAAIFSHLTKWKRGELVDQDSGAHPLVHAAWRCLAIACRETGNIPSGD